MLSSTHEQLLKEKGFIDVPLAEKNWKSEIQKLKKEKNAVILGHYYQEAPIQEVADFIGDSLGLSRKAASTEADVIVFCGVHFMAETAKILNPKKKVLLPDLKAGCSLSDSCPPQEFAEFKKQYPDALVISYINCSAEIKALSDIICTSSNAEHIVRSIPADKPIIFAPDKNLGKFLENKIGRKMILWDGACMVHEEFEWQQTALLLNTYPEAKFIAHPESPPEVLKNADFVGSTSQLLKFVKTDSSSSYVVATEQGIFHQMQLSVPDKTFIAASCNPQRKTCVCGICPHMKRNTLQKLYLCLEHEAPELTMPETLRKKAVLPIERMLKLSELIR